MITVTYEIDSEDRIQRVDGSWSSFAIVNGASQLTSDVVIGTQIWDWIAGSDVRHAYRLVFERVRESQKSVTLPFRCDSPDARRFMELNVSFRAGSALVFEAHLVRTEQRPPVDFVDPSSPRSDSLVALCSWCKRALAHGERWLEIEEAIPALGLFDRPSPSISHTICPDCETELDQRS